MASIKSKVTTVKYRKGFLEKTGKDLQITKVTNEVIVGRDSAVGIETCYGLDCPGIESRWGVKFSAPVQTSAEAHPASYTMDTGSFLGVKRPGRGLDQPPHIAPRLKQE